MTLYEMRTYTLHVGKYVPERQELDRFSIRSRRGPFAGHRKSRMTLGLRSTEDRRPDRLLEQSGDGGRIRERFSP